MVGMLAASGALDQLGRKHHRIWGDISDAEVLAKVMSFIRSAGALSRLKGQTYGLFGGRPLGMYTAVSNLDQWQKMFGLDVEHMEQQDVVEHAKEVDAVARWRARLNGSPGMSGADQIRRTRTDARKIKTPDSLLLRVPEKLLTRRRLDFIGTKRAWRFDGYVRHGRYRRGVLERSV